MTPMESMAIETPTSAAEHRARFTPERRLIFALALFFLLTLLAGVAVGAVSISPGQIVAIFAAPLGFELPWSFSEREAAVLLHIRAPRVTLGALAGAALALGGVLMQAIFRNPLADPGLIGVSSGAAVAAAGVTVLGAALPAAIGISALYALPIAAFLGGWMATAVVIRIARDQGQIRVDRMLLAGIAINALAGALIGILMLIADDAQLREVAFWSFGSLGRANWSISSAILILLVPIVFWGVCRAPWLNALLLGESEAALIGVPVESLKRGAVIFTCIAVGATIAFTGLIGFVGLVAPHLIRLMIGPDHRTLIPAAALLGATLLPAADLLARTAVAPIEIPIGLTTALLGAPFFLYLLVREQHRGDIS